ncbi:MOSC domain-containing protein [Demequina capsici]|uniref:MOSC domain-containing protein n=1 Tax=Demequina capsici TaxID=3075620 RepID=A0AA96F7S5_9MICO|nr:MULTISPECIES: MOSC domain-containing protein [unclassified Demequina]WNM24377.1 MOSC domain-containing protein [Demequina sp. OYTSA14]WNM27199.1 MOSC domain-containing protein [Demequina sp. PMTSA13]
MRVVSIRRYPVKSMAGESLESVELDARGLVGDRAWAVRDQDSRLASGKSTRRMVRRDAIFDYAARTDLGAVLVSDGTSEWPAGDPALDAALAAAMAADVRMASESDVPHFDDGAVSLIGTATLEWCARELDVDADPRRLRVNLVVQTQTPFVEETWFGRQVTIGGVALRPTQRIERCRTIDLPQDGVADRTRWLKGLGATRDMRVAVYCDVATPGALAVGDEVLLD